MVAVELGKPRSATSLITYGESQGSNWPSVSCSMISKPTPQSGCSNDRYFCPNRSRTSETVTARFMRCSCHQESVPTGALSETADICPAQIERASVRERVGQYV